MADERMSPWKSLYALTWIVFLEFLLALVPSDAAFLGWSHVALGVVIVGIAAFNFRALRATAAPGRVKRTSRSTLQLSVAMAVLGALLVLDVGAGWALLWGATVYGVVLVLHIVLALAILAQAAATGIAYDMWEEKEYLEATAPGDVPALPAPPKNIPLSARARP